VQDLLYVAAVVVFFALANAYLGFCDRIVGRDEHGPR
jgi:hypothetical protein